MSVREKPVHPQLISWSRSHKELAVVAFAGGYDHDDDDEAHANCDEAYDDYYEKTIGTNDGKKSGFEKLTKNLVLFSWPSSQTSTLRHNFIS